MRILLISAATLLPFAAFAAGSSSSPPAQTATTLECSSGEVAVKGEVKLDDQGLKIVEVRQLLQTVSYPVPDDSAAVGSTVEVCVDPATQSFNDQEIYDYAREVAYAGQYDRALKLLALAPNQDDPGILTYYGFVNRKMGNQAAADTYYLRAIAQDSANILARSYYGQGLVSQGKVDLAKAQLNAIEDAGGKGTWAHTSLQAVINGTSGYEY